MSCHIMTINIIAIVVENDDITSDARPGQRSDHAHTAFGIALADG